jgi:hypothetical protein
MASDQFMQMKEPIMLHHREWDDSRLTSVSPSPYVHIAIGDSIPPEWELQKKTAVRFHSSEELNFFHLQEKYKHSMRLDLLESILSRIPADQVIIMIDAFDVMFNGPLFSVYSLFLDVERMTPPDQHGRKVSILFNGERNCWPDTSIATQYPHQDLSTANPFLNAGVMVGRCGSILEVVRRKSVAPTVGEKEAWQKVSDDDQRYWTHAYLSSYGDGTLPRITVDHDCLLACCLYAQEPDALITSQGIVLMKANGARPCLIHFNGPTKAGMTEVARQLGYQNPLS